VPGVTGKKPIHRPSAAEREKAIEIKDMWIDIGASSRKEAEKLVAVGDPVVMRENFRMLNKNRFISKGTDDKIGAFIVAEVMRHLAKRQLNVAVYGVGTVQEEVGLRGAQASAFGIAPDAAFALDVGFTTDLPDIPKKLLGDTKLGAGPILKRNCDNNIVLGKILRNVANEKNIPYQESAAFRATGGTDTAAIQLSRSGVATALLSIPNSYMHSAVEMCDLRDAKAAVELLTETIASFKGDESFIPMA
jgi:endoglucanase